MKTYFLSAGVPLKSRHPFYYKTADIVAIRESIRCLMAAILPNACLVFGGQAAITPMIRTIANELGLDLRDHIILYQSLFFEKDFPADNAAFERVVLTERRNTLNESLQWLRTRMLTEHQFEAGIFIGGMEGIEAEWEMFTAWHPKAKSLPVASTGAAAKRIFDAQPNAPRDLAHEFAYLHLFRKHLEIDPA